MSLNISRSEQNMFYFTTSF
ncbi:unnamed protein product [Spirodela intermedia]|uniref:Uncharacterized protein n=1 Tax=Spirodela intermedia TaxID=51605 RepID=A0A7I8L7V8_SPIIN|nr:unnamed protein product [Spirodela intermedia]